MRCNIHFCSIFHKSIGMINSYFLKSRQQDKFKERYEGRNRMQAQTQIIQNIMLYV